MNNNKIKVSRILETTYEDGSFWVEYSLGEKTSYEYYESEDKPNNICTSEKEKLISFYEEKFNNDLTLYNKLVNKIDFNSIELEFSKLIKNCLESDNEMWYVEEEEFNTKEEIKKYIEKISKEVKRTNLENYVELREEDTIVTVFGGIITKVLF